MQVIHANGASQSGRSVQSVIKLLKSGELKDCPRVIVYCAYQFQAEEAAKVPHGAPGDMGGSGGGGWSRSLMRVPIFRPRRWKCAAQRGAW